jgi:hypothetical protein
VQTICNLATSERTLKKSAIIVRAAGESGDLVKSGLVDGDFLGIEADYTFKHFLLDYMSDSKSA